MNLSKDRKQKYYYIGVVDYIKKQTLEVISLPLLEHSLSYIV